MPAANLRTWAEIPRQDVPTFAQRFLYYNDPFVYEAMYGVCPFKAEGLARPASPVRGRLRHTAPPRHIKTIEAGP